MQKDKYFAIEREAKKTRRKSDTHSSTVNIIKVTTNAHRDAPQPMNVSLDKMSSSSGLHCDRARRRSLSQCSSFKPSEAFSETLDSCLKLEFVNAKIKEPQLKFKLVRVRLMVRCSDVVYGLLFNVAF